MRRPLFGGESYLLLQMGVPSPRNFACFLSILHGIAAACLVVSATHPAAVEYALLLKVVRTIVLFFYTNLIFFMTIYVIYTTTSVPP